MKSTTLPPNVEWRTASSPSAPVPFVQAWWSVVISLVKSRVPLVNFKPRDCLTNRKREFITFLFFAATTLFMVSTFYWLTEFLYGHGSCCQTGSVFIDKFWELNCRVWNSFPPFFCSIFLTILLRVFLALEDQMYTVAVVCNQFWCCFTSIAHYNGINHTTHTPKLWTWTLNWGF